MSDACNYEGAYTQKQNKQQNKNKNPRNCYMAKVKSHEL